MWCFQAWEIVEFSQLHLTLTQNNMQIQCLGTHCGLHHLWWTNSSTSISKIVLKTSRKIKVIFMRYIIRRDRIEKCFLCKKMLGNRFSVWQRQIYMLCWNSQATNNLSNINFIMLIYEMTERNRGSWLSMSAPSEAP